MAPRPQPPNFWQKNSLSIVLLSIFAFSIVGQALVGWKVHSEEQLQHGSQLQTFWSYLSTGHFLEAVFENMESEFLQMGLYVLLTAFLIQRGSAESRTLHDPERSKRSPKARFKKTKWLGVLYEHSLSIALLGLFVLFFLLHAWSGKIQHNEEQLEHGSPVLQSMWEYLSTPQFWFESFQNWQSEFFSVVTLVVLSIYLRQRGSPQSKAVPDSHAKTGD